MTASSEKPHIRAQKNQPTSRTGTLTMLGLLALVYSSPYAIPVFWLHLAQWFQLVSAENPGFLPSPVSNQTWYITFGAIAVFLPVAVLGLLNPFPKPDRFIAGSAAGWFLATAISALFVPGIQWAYADLFLLGAFLLIFSAAITIGPDGLCFTKMSVLAAIASVPIAIVALAQNAGYDPFPYSTTMPGSLDTVEGKHVVASLFGHPNYMGSYLAPVIALVLPLCLSGRSLVLRIFSAAVAILSLWALLIGGTRGPLLALVCGFGIYLVMLPRPSFAAKKMLIASGVAAIVFVLIAILVPAIRPGFELTERFLGSKEIASRAFYWRVGLYALAEKPVFGIGLGQFDNLFWKNVIKTPGTAPGEPWHFVLSNIIRGVRPGQMHNDHLQVLVETGTIGALFWAAFWATIVRKGLVVKQAVLSPADSTRNAALMAAFGVIFFDGLFNFPLHLPCSGALFWFLAGLYAAWRPRIDPGYGVS